MNAQELVGKTQDELKDMLMNLRKEQFTLRMQHVSGQLTNPSLLRNIRRDVARVKTAANGSLKAAAQPVAKKTAKKADTNKSVAEAKTTSTTKAAPEKVAVKKTTTKAAPKKAAAKKAK